MGYSKTAIWSPAEDERLKDILPRVGNWKDAQALMPSRSVPSIRYRATALGLTLGSDLLRPAAKVEAPPSAHRTVEELIAYRREEYRRKAAHHEGKQDIRITVPETLPWCVAISGDPHVDDSGTDIDHFIHVCETVSETPGMYGMNVGDFTNNWCGRLERLYAHQGVGSDEATDLLEHFIREYRWLAIIQGNHDKWSTILGHLCRVHGVCAVSHGGTFVLSDETGATVKIAMRHDFPGRSQYTPAFGPSKQNFMGSDADIIVAGHSHESAYQLIRNKVTGKLGHCVRVGAFKVHDDYAEANHLQGSTVSPVFCPIIIPGAADDLTRIIPCFDIDQAAHLLSLLRQG